MTMLNSRYTSRAFEAASTNEAFLIRALGELVTSHVSKVIKHLAK